MYSTRQGDGTRSEWLGSHVLISVFEEWRLGFYAVPQTYAYLFEVMPLRYDQCGKRVDYALKRVGAVGQSVPRKEGVSSNSLISSGP